jgi:hypothetical protein
MYHGWLEDAIWALGESDWDIFHKLPYCLVTCVDSSPHVGFIATAEGIIDRETSCSVYGEGLLVCDARIAEVAERYKLLVPFCEMWLFEKPPKIEKPGTFSIVAPLNLNEDPLPEGLLEWFNASGCVLGLGDGIGLNYVTREKSILNSLMERQKLPPSGSTITTIEGAKPS